MAGSVLRISDAPALLQHGSPGDLGGMRGKDRNYTNLAERLQRLRRAESLGAQPLQRAAKSAGQRRLLRMHAGRAAAAFAVIGFR